MIKTKNFGINTYVVILIAVFAISSIITNVIFFNTLQNIIINGTLYSKIKQSKDLKADILPPKLYIVESYLLIHQLITEKDESKIEKLIKKIEKFRNEYFEYYTYWKNSINDKNLEILLISDSHSYVVDFFKIYDTKLIPSLIKKDNNEIQSIIIQDMQQLFDLHRNKIDSASILIEASNENIESNAKIEGNNSVLMLTLVYIISLAFVLIISVIFFRRIKVIENRIVMSQRETEMANNRLESIINGLRRFKHSYDNMLASVKGYIVNSDIKGLNNYIDEIIIEKKQSDMKNYISLDSIKDSGLMGLLMSKLMYAERFNIDFRIKIDSEIEELEIREIDFKISYLCEVLGVLLDNSVEAAAESQQKKINLVIINNNEVLAFEIENSTDFVPDRIKMFEKGWTTKGNNRGLGLWIIKNIVSKHPNVILNTFIKDTLVKQELLINKKMAKIF